MSYDAFDVAVVENYAYLIDSGYGVRIIDVSNPANPSVINSYHAIGARCISKSGENIYVTQSSVLLVYEIIDGGQSLDLVDTITTSDSAMDVFVPSTRGFIRK